MPKENGKITPEEEAVALCQKQPWATGLSKAMVGREAPVEVRDRVKKAFCEKLVR